MRYIYMDHAATTPVDPEVLDKMIPFFSEHAGNPSSFHRAGRIAREALESARKRTATALGADPREIYFTSGGTESDNWALKGMAMAGLRQGRKHIITSAIEHHAILNTCRFLEKRGFRITLIPVDGTGMVSPEAVEKAIASDTALISIMAANNEVGSIQPISEISAIAKKHGVLFHTDAVQAIGSVPIDVNDMGVDLLSLSAHKFYGPKETGVLYIRRSVLPENLIHGGKQERSRRSGTENVPGITGLSYAIEKAVNHLEKNTVRLERFRDQLVRGILDNNPGTVLNGSLEKRLPGNVNISFPGIDADQMLVQLELKGIMASAGAACASGQAEASHVLKAMGLPWERIISAVRFSLGASTTKEDIDYVISEMPIIINNARLRRGKL